MPSLQDFLTHPIETLEKALHLRRQIDQLNKSLKELIGPTSASLLEVQPEPAPKRRGRRKMSAASKAKIAAAQRARWAKQKGTDEPMIIVGPVTAKERRKLASQAKARKAAIKKAQSTKANSTGAAAKPGRKKKRHLSPEARGRIVAAVKARWAREKKRKS
jgi:leucyl aminopeptidase (aminopeptidase T)